MHKINVEKKYNIVGIGEVLWDISPEDKKLGEAPVILFIILNNWDTMELLSAGLEDTLGKEIIQSLDELNLSTNYIQIDPIYPTGTADVILKSKNKPEYIIR